MQHESLPKDEALPKETMPDDEPAPIATTPPQEPEPQEFEDPPLDHIEDEIEDHPLEEEVEVVATTSQRKSVRFVEGPDLVVEAPLPEGFVEVVRRSPRRSSSKKGNLAPSSVCRWFVLAMDLALGGLLVATRAGVPVCCGESLLDRMLFVAPWEEIVVYSSIGLVGLSLLEALAWKVHNPPAYAVLATITPLLLAFLVYATLLDLGPNLALYAATSLTLSNFLRALAYRLDHPSPRSGPVCLALGLNLATLVGIGLWVMVAFVLVAGGLCVDENARPFFFEPTRDAAAFCPADCTSLDDDLSGGNETSLVLLFEGICEVCDAETNACFLPFSF